MKLAVVTLLSLLCFVAMVSIAQGKSCYDENTRGIMHNEVVS